MTANTNDKPRETGRGGSEVPGARDVARGDYAGQRVEREPGAPTASVIRHPPLAQQNEPRLPSRSALVIPTLCDQNRPVFAQLPPRIGPKCQAT